MATIERHVTRDVVALEASTPCSEAARLMAERHIGSVAVKREGRIVGLVTERDLVTRLLARGSAGSLPVSEAMRTDVPSVSPSSTEVECASLMRQNTTRHLLVRDGAEVAGIVSMRDVIQLMLDEKQWLIEQLHVFIQGRDLPREPK